jgi:hypothetical protein
VAGLRLQEQLVIAGDVAALFWVERSVEVAADRRNSSISTATEPPAWAPPSAGERQPTRLLRLDLKPSEQAEHPLPPRKLAQRSPAIGRGVLPLTPRLLSCERAPHGPFPA